MNKNLMVSDLEPFIKQSGNVKVQSGRHSLELNLEHVHERRYLLKLIMNARYPQSDIDSKIYAALIRPTDKILDAGANIGFTVIEFLNLGVSNILALEPVPEIYQRLIALQSDKVSVLNCAISSHVGESDMFVSESHNQGNSLRTEFLDLFPKVYGKEIKKVQVKVETIDSLYKEYGGFDVWKLDIEGSECDALKGASFSLSNKPPRIIIAELYKDFFPGFLSLIKLTHPYVYRAFLSKDNYELLFLDIANPKPEHVYNTSPTYVFMTEELTL